MESKQILRQEGDYWTITFEDQVIRLRDTKGLRYLATLLTHPGRQLAATDIVKCSNMAQEDGAPGTHGSDKGDLNRRGRRVERARITVTKGLKSAVDRIAEAHPTLGEHLRATIRRGYACVYLPDPRRPRWEV